MVKSSSASAINNDDQISCFDSDVREDFPEEDESTNPNNNKNLSNKQSVSLYFFILK